jgi:hypothetical protein
MEGWVGAKRLIQLVGGNKCRDRHHSTAQRLAKEHGIDLDAGIRGDAERPTATQTCLNFIADDKYAGGMGIPRPTAKQRWIEPTGATLPLHGLEYEGGNVASCDLTGYPIGIVSTDVSHMLQQRLEALPEGGVPSQGQGPQSLPMEAVLDGKYAHPAA